MFGSSISPDRARPRGSPPRIAPPVDGPLPETLRTEPRRGLAVKLVKVFIEFRGGHTAWLLRPKVSLESWLRFFAELPRDELKA